MELERGVGEKKSLIQGILILVIFFGGIMLYNYIHNRIDRGGIENAIQDVMSQGLLNPSNAKFSDDEHTTITKNDDGTYTVDGYVDATNGFGATIRSNYEATVTPKDGDYYVKYKIQNALTGEWQ